ncbi:MAG: NAD(P)/FAD-dependent oxidoreductase [Kineosporiaceae bacterium]
MSTDADIAIVGAGPAGALAALGALEEWPGARVLLLDRADFPRDKVCGDGVTVQAEQILAEVGSPGLLDGLNRVWRLRLGFPSGREAARTMRQPAIVVRRLEFDAILVREAQRRGATLQRHRFRSLQVLGDTVVIDGTVRVPVVIGADGAESRVAAAIGRGGHGGRTAIAIRGYAPVRPELADAQVIAFRGVGRAADPRDTAAADAAVGRDLAQLAYAWSFPLGDGWANVGYGELLPVSQAPDAPRRATRTELLEGLDLLLPGASAGGGAWQGHRLPLSGWRDRQPAGRVLLTGDALGLVNPLTGEGIHAAMRSGAIAGRIAAGWVRDGAAATPQGPGERYRSELGRATGWHRRHMAVAARLSTIPRALPAGIDEAARHQGVFDDLVEMGLADGLITPRLVGAAARRTGERVGSRLRALARR